MEGEAKKGKTPWGRAVHFDDLIFKRHFENVVVVSVVGNTKMITMFLNVILFYCGSF